jgi:large subunit ribosomal protein L24
MKNKMCMQVAATSRGTAAKLKLKKNDRVLVTAGKNRGVEGRVLRVLPASGKAIVEGVNFVKRHTRANPQRQVKGGILEKEAPIRIDNLKVICPDCGKPSRMGLKRLEDGTGVRYCKACGGTLK